MSSVKITAPLYNNITLKTINKKMTYFNFSVDGNVSYYYNYNLVYSDYQQIFPNRDHQII